VVVVQYTYTQKQYKERHKTNNTYSNTKIHRTTQKIHRTTQKMHRTTQKIHRTTQILGRVRAVLRLCGFYPGICLTTEEKARKKTSVRVAIRKNTIRIHSHNNKNT